MGLGNLKNRKRNFGSLSSKLDGKTYQKDDRFWEYTPDESQNGESIIRFLPGVQGEEDDPIILFKQYFINTPKGLFAADARENAGLESFPANVANDLWAKYNKTKDENYKELFKQRVAKKYYIANIYVVKDPANPENEGKVFLYKFGQYIKDIIFEQMGIESEYKKKRESSILIEEAPKEPYDPFDLWDGANFYITSFSKTGKAINRKYEGSKFLKRAPLSNDDAELERIYSQVYSLQEFLSPDKYEDYDTQKTRYLDMTGDYEDIFPEKVVDSVPVYNREPKTKDTSSITDINSSNAESVVESDNRQFVEPSQSASINIDDDDDDLKAYEDILNGN